MYFLMCLFHSYEAKCGDQTAAIFNLCKLGFCYFNNIYIHGNEISTLTIFTHDTFFHLHCSNVYEEYCDNL